MEDVVEVTGKSAGKAKKAAEMAGKGSGSFEDLKKLFHDILYDSAAYPKTVALAILFEEKTKQKRENMAYGFLAVWSFYLIVGYFSELVVNFTSFVYPAYQSFKAIRSVDKEDDTQWLTYWTVFASFCVLDFFSEPINDALPLYWLVKCFFLFYLYAPGVRGAAKVYNDVVEPVMTKIEVLVEGKEGKKE